MICLEKRKEENEINSVAAAGGEEAFFCGR